MKHLIESIRSAKNMSQEEFASILGTTTSTIDDWESGKSEPDFSAQVKLHTLCKDGKINVSQPILDNRTYKPKGNDIVLYHGSKKGINGEIAPISREKCDFGRGFYMGTDVLQALTLICNEENPRFYTVKLDLTGLKVLKVDINMDWAMLIAYHRGEMEDAEGTPIYEKYANMSKDYDVVVGYIANNRMYTVLSSFFNGTLTDVALIHCLSALNLGKQYVAISQKACKQIEILKEETLSQLELALLRDMSAERRVEGVKIAKKIEIEYRREGRYFDELLRGD